MLGHVLGALVALFGLFGVGAVVCVQLSGPSSLGADAGMTGFSLSLPLLDSHQLRPAWAGCLGWFEVRRPVTGRSFGRLDRPVALHTTFIRTCVASCVCHQKANPVRSKHASKMKAPRGSNAEAPPTRIVVAVAPDANRQRAATHHGQTRGAPHHFYTAVCCVLRMSSKS